MSPVFLKDHRFLDNIIFLRAADITIPDIPEEPEVSPEGEGYGWNVIIFDRDDLKVLEYSSFQGSSPVSSIRFDLVETGSGTFEMTLSEWPSTEIGYSFRVDIHLFGEPEPRFSGHVLGKPEEGDTSGKYKFTGHGLYYQLAYARVNRSYDLQPLDTIARDILTTDVQPFTDIRYDGTKIISPGYVATAISFNRISARESLLDLAEIATNFVIGVGPDRAFFFRPVSTAVTADACKWAAHHISQISVERDVSDIINDIDILSGELESGSNYAATVEDAASIATFGRRWGKATIPSALSSGDAERWGEFLLESKANPLDRARLRNVELFNNDLIEAYGYMRFTDNHGTQQELPIKRVQYHLRPNERIKVDVDLGDVDFLAINTKYVGLLRRIASEEALQQSNMGQI
jgi:hypothetical protein